MSRARARPAVALLSAQALAFGVTLALLVIPANALFLDAYGAEWLPATYIAIAVVGSGASALIARAARRTRLARVATATLGALALLFGASWVILVAGGVWVSAVLLVLFPIALQIGFVFIGGQAGRLLDVREMKELFPRVVSGFAVGFLLGGLLAIPLLALLGSTQQLLLATTVGAAHVPCSPAPHRATVPGGPRGARRGSADPLPGRRSGRCSSPASCCCSSPTRCCRPWARRSSTSCCSTGRQRSTAATT